MSRDLVLSVERLGFPWKTLDPFLFCVHHDDHYPPGNAELGPAASLAGRTLGNDFEGKDGWRMYHGETVPGFPQHPHRGFETVTVVRRGLIDHSDSLGAAARFGRGDAQWLTAGKGIVHSEMFPLLDPHGPNPVELFQIWLNLPRASKFAEPHFSMLWADTIPRVTAPGVTVDLVAGALEGVTPPSPPPDSWASRTESDVAIWTVTLDAEARWTLPPAQPGTNRMLYFFAGTTLRVGETLLRRGDGARLAADRPAPLEAGEGEAQCLVLQGRPIGEPVVNYGPFVMTSAAELQQTFLDYQRTGFGGWPWKRDDPVHPKDSGRFARHADGRTERREG
jgi:redox-sensitive bicupin YhaK (pirin superfamily)